MMLSEKLLQECIEYAAQQNLAPDYRKAAIGIYTYYEGESGVSRTDEGGYEIAINPGNLSDKERKAVIAHELAHVYCGHCDLPDELGTGNTMRSLFTGHQRHEREAIRMAVHIYPEPKAHIDRLVREYNTLAKRHNALKPVEGIPRMQRAVYGMLRIATAFDLRMAEAGNRTHPEYSGQINEICNMWKGLAAQGLCEPVDIDFLKRLPERLQTKISILHDSKRSL